MSSYFKILMETGKTARLMTFVITDYISNKRIGCNMSQIATLHLLTELGGGGSPSEMQEDIQAFSRNNTANYLILVKNGYIISRKGDEVGLSGRATFYEITPKGKRLYKEVCDYVDKKMSKMMRELEWNEENIEDYMADLVAIQYFLMGK